MAKEDYLKSKAASVPDDTVVTLYKYNHDTLAFDLDSVKQRVILRNAPFNHLAKVPISLIKPYIVDVENITSSTALKAESEAEKAFGFLKTLMGDFKTESEKLGNIIKRKKDWGEKEAKELEQHLNQLKSHTESILAPLVSHLSKGKKIATPPANPIQAAVKVEPKPEVKPVVPPPAQPTPVSEAQDEISESMSEKLLEKVEEFKDKVEEAVKEETEKIEKEIETVKASNKKKAGRK